jgi:hypothetical protein
MLTSGHPARARKDQDPGASFHIELIQDFHERDSRTARLTTVKS